MIADFALSIRLWATRVAARGLARASFTNNSTRKVSFPAGSFLNFEDHPSELKGTGLREIHRLLFSFRTFNRVATVPSPSLPPLYNVFEHAVPSRHLSPRLYQLHADLGGRERLFVSPQSTSGLLLLNSHAAGLKPRDPSSSTLRSTPDASLRSRSPSASPPLSTSSRSGARTPRARRSSAARRRRTPCSRSKTCSCGTSTILHRKNPTTDLDGTPA